MSLSKRTLAIADAIIHTLKQNGVKIQRYDSVTSHSVYLKLDYGVLKTVRISDHNGKKHLKYRYNIQTNIRAYKYDRYQQRFYFPEGDVQGLLRQILKDRDDKKARYGNKHDVYMMKNIEQNAHKNGFWAESRVV